MTDQNQTNHRGYESRADRMRRPRAVDVARATAEQHGVCTKPIARERVDTHTGRVEVVPVACGSTQASVCPTCAEKAKRLRMAQCREGWHLDQEPDFTPDEPSEDMKALLSERGDLVAAYQEVKETGRADVLASIADTVGDIDADLRALGMRGKLPPLDPPDKPARKRSTRRRQDMPNLPRKKVTKQTVGAVFAAQYRPSMFITLTLDSYGPVHSRRVRNGRVIACGCGDTHHKDDPRLGIPLDTANYDYRRAARDAVHFPKLVDRFWQNLRRCVGWDVQYFATVEPQKRNAPHLHAAIRGAIPRETLRQVAAATYHQVWWPPHDQLVYDSDRVPVWDIDRGGFTDPDTRTPLPTWEEALDTLADDEDQAEPAHLVQAGPQLDIQGVLAGSNRADKAIGYLTKYLTKSVDECHEPSSSSEQEHADRLLAELERTPCSPRCPVWLLYGIQPQGVRQSITPGRCRGKAHKPATLGIAGRRVLVSRKWSGKSLADHRHDRREFVQAMLAHLGIIKTTDEEPGRYQWHNLDPSSPNMPPRDALLLHAVSERMRWRAEYEQAKAAAEGRPPCPETSATPTAA